MVTPGVVVFVITLLSPYQGKVQELRAQCAGPLAYPRGLVRPVLPVEDSPYLFRDSNNL
jgi:hypothetical protein